MKKLLNGIINFRKNTLKSYRDNFENLVKGQTPDALMIACCDSRVVPNTFASTNPGDLFVVRNIGNLVSGNSVNAAIDFSLLALNVKDIIVCGHSECGAMQTLLSNVSAVSSISQWLDGAKDALINFHQVCGNGCKDYNLLSKYNIETQLNHLKSYPIVKERLDAGKLRIHGWWFELSTANLYALNANNEFQLLDVNYAKKLLDKL